MNNIFDWLGDIFTGIGDAVGSVFDTLGQQISNTIWNTMLQWFYETIYGAVADFFTVMGNMGADIFDLNWVKATIHLFTLFGWSLFVAGVVVAIFDVAIEYQNGRTNVKTTCLNILKGFFACSLIGVIPVELYKFCVSLQNTFSHDLSRFFAGTQSFNLAKESMNVLEATFAIEKQLEYKLFNILILIAFAYCVIKIFFANIKRGGILLIQISVGALYMFSVPRGYSDGFTQWCKQVIAICLTAFMQTTLLFLGLYPQNLKATANLWLWSLRDFCIMGIAALLSILILVKLRFFVPAAVTLCFGFLTIRMDDTTVLDYLKYAFRYFISTQQYFEWR